MSPSLMKLLLFLLFGTILQALADQNRRARKSTKVIPTVLDLLHASAEIVVMCFDLVFARQLRFGYAAAVESERREIQEQRIETRLFGANHSPHVQIALWLPLGADDQIRINREQVVEQIRSS